MKSELKKRRLKDLADAYLQRDLRVNPEYQRGTVWNLPQKQALIDSLLRGYQIPLFYVHLKQSPNTFVHRGVLIQPSGLWMASSAWLQLHLTCATNSACQNRRRKSRGAWFQACWSRSPCGMAGSLRNWRSRIAHA